MTALADGPEGGDGSETFTVELGKLQKGTASSSACTSGICKATAKVAVSLKTAPLTTVSVNYHTVAMGAATSANFLSKSDALTFKPGVLPKKFLSFVTLGDNAVQGAEGFDVVFTNPSGPNVTGSGHVEIDND